jgi:hypothetical protein
VYHVFIERVESQKRLRINTSLVVLLAVVLIGYLANVSHSQIIKYSSVILLAIFSYYLVLNAKKEGFAAGFCVLLGCITIISGILISNGAHYVERPVGKYDLFVETLAERIQALQSDREFLHLYSLFTGVSCIALGLVFAYRPSLVQVKNHIPFDYPYPIWNSKNQPTTQFRSLVSTKDLLTAKERMLSCRFKYLLVSIDEKLYLASPNERIPQNSVIMRTKSSQALCGVSRF